MKKLLLLLLIIPLFANGQPLGKERVERLRNSVVKIIIDDTLVMGTGFIVTKNGYVLTCFHVIAPALVGGNQGIQIRKKISIEFYDGEKVEIGGIASGILTDKIGLQNAVGYDYCILAVNSGAC